MVHLVLPETINTATSKEQWVLPSPTSNRIATGRLGTIAAILTTLATLAPTQNTRSDAAHEPHGPPHALAHRNSLPSSVENMSVPAPDAEVTHFRSENGRFTCRFGDSPISGTIAENGSITDVHFHNLTISLSQPVTEQTLERFLRSATGTAALLHARNITPNDGLMEAIGGARFLLTTGTGEKEQRSLATLRDLLTIDPADEVRRIEAETGWKDALKRITSLSRTQQETIDARIEVHNGRMRVVYDDITWRLQRSQQWYYWHERRNEFVYGWNAISDQWQDASVNKRGELVSSFHKHLKSWEDWLSLQPQGEAEEDFRSRYDGIIRDLADARKQEKTLRASAHTRTLRDEQRDIAVTEHSSHLSTKNFAREERSGATLLAREEYEDDVRTKRTAFDAMGTALQETLWTSYAGGQVRRAQEYEPKDGTMKLQRQTDYWRNGNTHAVLDKRSDALAYFGEQGRLLYEDVAQSNRAKRQRGMVDAQGNRFGLYRDEKVKNANLTTSQYLDMLAKKLDTTEKIAVFFEQFLWYKSDVGDEWLSADELVQRTEEYEQSGAHYMRDDCDGYAFLARDILRRQGKNAHVLYIPGHAICVWVEKDAEGEYHARSQGTFGADHNGNRYGRDYPRDREKAKGFAKLIDALNALMKKYRFPGLGLREGQDYTLDENAIWIMPNPPSGNYRTVTADYFLQKVS